MYHKNACINDCDNKSTFKAGTPLLLWMLFLEESISIKGVQKQIRVPSLRLSGAT